MQHLLQHDVNDLSDEQLVSVIQLLNTEYRHGNALVSDNTFDHIYISALKSRLPNHPFLTSVQPDNIGTKGLIKHTVPMLSTAKAYSLDEITSFVSRCEAAATKVGVDTSNLIFRITPKFDGNAGALYQGNQIVSRGDGVQGRDFSNLLQHGLKIVGNISDVSVGEVIIDLKYFNEKLAHKYKNARNFIGGVVNSDNLSEHAIQALSDGAIQFIIFDSINALQITGAQLLANLDSIEANIKSHSPFELDGIVIEVVDSSVKQYMGSATSHHYWMIAKKTVGESVKAIVNGISWQVGRTGKISPILNIEPVEISGVTVSNVTAHHAANVLKSGLGKGAEIEVVRSGEVIPYCKSIIKPVDTPVLPTSCPSCGDEVALKNDFLMCQSSACLAQVENSIIYHFKLLGADLFGSKSVEKMVAYGLDSFIKIHRASESDFINAGFGAGQAKNLYSEIQRVRTEPLADSHLLASLGISKLGRGSSKRILAIHKIDTVSTLQPCDIKVIDGFATLTSQSISKALHSKHGILSELLSLEFNLTHSSEEEVVTEGSLLGVNICFTGTMTKATRSQMQDDAASKGAIVNKTVKKDSLLVCGDKVGAKKIEAAQAKGATIISEDDYFSNY